MDDLGQPVHWVRQVFGQVIGLINLLVMGPIYLLISVTAIHNETGTGHEYLIPVPDTMLRDLLTDQPRKLENYTLGA